MSLTNPKDVITEERLSEFYGEILPYLGGMPEVLANKFAKGDLYSTSEKIIGCWTNGKPLYQKTFIDTSSFTVGTTYVYKDIGNLTGLNVEDIVSVDGTGGYSADAGRYPLPLSFTDSKTVCIDCFIFNGTNIRIRGRRSEGTAVYANFIVTVQYTKTTDAANSFKYGNETDYSTTEKIIGTWIDGKPLYQKTVNFGALPNNTSKFVDHNISNLSQIIDLKTMVYTGTSWLTLSYISPGNLASAIYCSVTSTQIKIETGADRSNWTAYATIQYTKTTD